MTMAKKLNPIHPGVHLREDFMKPLGLSSNALAHALEVTPARINEILRERRGISADTALRLARFFGSGIAAVGEGGPYGIVRLLVRERQPQSSEAGPISPRHDRQECDQPDQRLR